MSTTKHEGTRAELEAQLAELSLRRVRHEVNGEAVMVTLHQDQDTQADSEGIEVTIPNQEGKAMVFFAWAAGSEPPTFTGPANHYTGKRSQLGSLSAFAWRKDRERFIAQTRGGAVAVTARQARKLKAGLDDRAFNELVAVLVGGEL